MFPLGIYLPYVTVLYFSMFFLVQAISFSSYLRITRIGILGWLTSFLVLLLLRILDEFKDAETDKKLFPKRPLPRGDVKYRDIKILGTVVVVIMVGLNLLAPEVFIAFGMLLLYIWLTYKWFFLRKVISNNLILTLITHQPLALFLNFYIVATAFAVVGVEQINTPVFIAVLAFLFPVTAWETSRKIRVPEQETEYVTYSKLFGCRKASLLPLLSLIASTLLFIYLGYYLQFSILFFVSIILVMVYVLVTYVRFLIHPVAKNLKLKPVTEITGILFSVIVMTQLIIKNFLFVDII